MTGPVTVAGRLVRYRYAVYLGGLAVVALPLVLADLAGVVLGPVARAAMVVPALAAMVVTYAAERRARASGTLGSDGDGAHGSTGGDGAGGDATADEPSTGVTTGQRVLLVLAGLGAAAGGYAAAVGQFVGGAGFLLGSLLLARRAVLGGGSR